MITLRGKEDCCGCGGCYAVCPQGCISMKKDKEGFLYPHVNEAVCTDCGMCETVCPIINAAVSQGSSESWAVYAKSEELVKCSSSGGVFSVLAETVINDGGVVFGAAFDTEWKVRTRKAESLEELNSLRKAKYVQCETGNAYCEIKNLLLQGVEVLYCSTPCQIAGLLSFLDGKCDNLYTVDIVCHGVASPDVWQYYLSLQKETIRLVNFRDKRDGWEKNSISLQFSNARELVERNAQNPYMQAFLHGLSVRPSCFACKFKGLHRACDITLGDLWGAEHQCPEGYNFYGTSLVLVHSKRGQHLMDRCKDKFHRVKAPMPASIAFNGSIQSSLKKPVKREWFMERYQNEDFDTLVHDCLPIEVPRKVSLRHRIIMKLKRVFTCCR